ncbi:Uncharacterised protein [Bordetella pseudohinzii]|nr:Uncharacterised protein [Bordetella pseudohinzii]
MQDSIHLSLILGAARCATGNPMPAALSLAKQGTRS